MLKEIPVLSESDQLPDRFDMLSLHMLEVDDDGTWTVYCSRLGSITDEVPGELHTFVTRPCLTKTRCEACTSAGPKDATNLDTFGGFTNHDEYHMTERDGDGGIAYVIPALNVCGLAHIASEGDGFTWLDDIMSAAGDGPGRYLFSMTNDDTGECCVADIFEVP